MCIFLARRRGELWDLISCPERSDDLMQPCPVCFHIPAFVLYEQQLNGFPSFVFT